MLFGSRECHLLLRWSEAHRQAPCCHGALLDDEIVGWLQRREQRLVCGLECIDGSRNSLRFVGWAA
jgi:hypothetical protein